MSHISNVFIFLSLLTALLGTFFGSQTALAEPNAAELDDLFAFRGLVYRQEDDGKSSGNPHLREDALIYEGIFFLQNNVNEHNASTVKFTGDLVSAASYDDARNKAETVSAATGYNPGRFNLELGWKHLSDRRTGINAHVSYGQEFAYRSQGYGLGLSQSFAEDATQVSASVQIFDDQVRIIRYDGSKEKDQNRDTVSYDLSLTQSLTPVSLVNIGWSHTEQQGFLATSFNSVVINSNQREIERVPDTRYRDAVSVRYKHAIGNDSIQTGLSYYEDSWDIRAKALELKYFLRSRKGKVSVEPSYRYYDQDEASFFAFDFDRSQAYQTSDSDLGDFDGHAFGLLYSVKGPSWFTQYQATYDIGVDYYLRSDDLKFYWLTLGWRFPL